MAKNLSSGVSLLIGIVIFLAMLGALGPTIFSSLNWTGSPAWVQTTAPIVVGGGLIYAVYKLFF
jgi:hypothetical protein